MGEVLENLPEEYKNSLALVQEGKTISITCLLSALDAADIVICQLSIAP